MVFKEMGISVIEILNNTLDKHLPRMISEEIILHSDRDQRICNVLPPLFPYIVCSIFSAVHLQGY